MAVKACIMAGGKGVRLRPMTNVIPKPMAPLLGKPVIYHILDLLKKHKITEAAVTLGYKAGILKQALEAYDAGIELSFSVEKAPLGTAGGVKKAIQSHDDDVLVISGDAMCDLDLSRAISFHKQKKSVATIIACPVDDPREYGVICTDKEGRITGFLEKPSYQSCTTNLVSTGIYLLSQEALSIIGDTPCDFAKDIFPKLLAEGKPMYAVSDSGYWCDVGDIESYLRCQQDMLFGRVSFSVDASFSGGVYYAEADAIYNATVIAPAYIGAGVQLDKGAAISGSVIGNGCRIGADTVIEGSVLHTNVFVGDGSTLHGALCCDGARLVGGVAMHEDSVAGQGAVIGEDATICRGVKLWEEKKLCAGEILREDLQQSGSAMLCIDDDGISGLMGTSLTPLSAVRLGAGIAGLCKDAVVAVAHDEAAGGEALYHGVIAGILAAGGQVWQLDNCIKSCFSFCMSKTKADYGIYIKGGKQACISMQAQGGLPIKRAQERSLEAAINRGEYTFTDACRNGTSADFRSLARMYEIELLKQCESLEDFPYSIAVKSIDKDAKGILEQAITRLGGVLGEGLAITLSRGGEEVSWSFKGGSLHHEHILALCCMYEFEHGNDVAVLRTAPQAIDTIAKRYGRVVHRYESCPCNENDTEARTIAHHMPMLRDGLMMSLRLLQIVNQKELELSKLVEMLPEFFTSTRLVSIASSPMTLIKQLSGEKVSRDYGVDIAIEGRNALLRPIKSGRGMMIFAESDKAETAAEICDFFEQAIRDVSMAEGGGLDS